MDALARAATLFGHIFFSSPVLAILWICAVVMAISSAVRISSLLRQDWKPKPEATGQSPRLVRILAAPGYRKDLDQLFWSFVVAFWRGRGRGLAGLQLAEDRRALGALRLAGQRPQLDRHPGLAKVSAALTMKSRWSASTLHRLTRIALVLAAAAAAFHVVDYVMDRRDVLARVPEPLEVEAIEYRLEQAWGLGFMPGDNETGFVVYRLTAPSAAWATAQGQNLGEQLPGGAQKWRPTPVDESEVDTWHHYDDEPVRMTETRPATHRTTISEFLEKYGFTIPIEQGRDAEANHAITSDGSFYALGRGGSVTIVDPARGKVYFAYAG